MSAVKGKIVNMCFVRTFWDAKTARACGCFWIPHQRTSANAVCKTFFKKMFIHAWQTVLTHKFFANLEVVSWQSIYLYELERKETGCFWKVCVTCYRASAWRWGPCISATCRYHFSDLWPHSLPPPPLLPPPLNMQF